MKKETVNQTSNSNNGFGIASVILGIVGVLAGGNGVIFGIIALIFSIKQKKIHKNSWSKAGFILSIIAIILGIISIIVAITYLSNNQEFAKLFAQQ